MTLAQKIQEILTKELSPDFLELRNDSARHVGHAGHDGSGESHFTLRIVSSRFDGKSRIERQRMILNLLRREMDGPLHALSIKAFSPKEC
ncbi:MAG: BolA family transcriptional regulator [Rhodospirillales bacterium]|nr:BolA family transcriptional regulator [Alphaproteobacteria bacterium]USO03133.1 MAG: BolA family transcriptional regulator [Rhodospirillales bacterium]